jgi:hypothetical protein
MPLTASSMMCLENLECIGLLREASNGSVTTGFRRRLQSFSFLRSIFCWPHSGCVMNGLRGR